MPLKLNALFDSRYIISKYLASGGMAEIYEAQDVVINKPVALKFIKDKYLESFDAVEQFKNEARYISIFNHPNIMRIYNVGEFELKPYVSYELLKGKTFKTVKKPAHGRSDSIAFTLPKFTTVYFEKTE